MSLQRQTIAALGWSGAEKIGQTVVGLLVQIVLARLLFPADFALIAMLAIFLELGRSFADAGFTSALIQQEQVSERDLAAVFFFNLCAAVALAATMALAGGAVAAFYDQPLLRSMLAVLALRVVFDALGTVHGVVLSRRIDFRSQTFARLPATLVGGVVGVTMALRGFGAWALVGQILSQSVVRTTLLWARSGWRPRAGLRLEPLRRLLPFGSRILGAALLEKTVRNLYLVVIGKSYPPAELGYYHQARKYQSIPSMPFTRVLNHVLMPVFSTAQRDREKLGRALLQGARLVGFAYLPGMLWLAAASPTVIEVVLTSKWLPAAPYLSLLCLAGASLPLLALNVNLITALGDADGFFRLELRRRVAELLALAATVAFGITAMIVGQVVAAWLGWWWSAGLASRRVGVDRRSLLGSWLPYLACGVVAAAVVRGLAAVDLPLVARLAAQAIVGPLLYLALVIALRLPGPAEARRLWAASRSGGNG